MLVFSHAMHSSHFLLLCTLWVNHFNETTTVQKHKNGTTKCKGLVAKRKLLQSAYTYHGKKEQVLPIVIHYIKPPSTWHRQIKKLLTKLAKFADIFQVKSVIACN